MECGQADAALRRYIASPSLYLSWRRTRLNDIAGNTLGLKPSELQRLRNTYRRRVSAHEIVSAELARHLTELSRDTHRQVGVLLNRKGDVEQVVVGDAQKLELPDASAIDPPSP